MKKGWAKAISVVLVGCNSVRHYIGQAISTYREEVAWDLGKVRRWLPLGRMR